MHLFILYGGEVVLFDVNDLVTLSVKAPDVHNRVHNSLKLGEWEGTESRAGRE